MTEANVEARTSDFLLPELNRIGDTVCEILRFGVDEELLGSSILQRIQGMLSQGRLTSADVVRLALFVDALRITEEAIEADGATSDTELGYVLPLAQAASKRLALFRRFYGDFGETSRDNLREFLTAHGRDTQLFGGSCSATRWLGLEVVRRVSHETCDREPLDRYAELMVRLFEEIVALDVTGAARDQRRAELEARMQLRKRLAEAQATAPATAADPRIRVFCAADAPEVFHSVEHAQQVFHRDPLDVEVVHQQTRDLFSRLVHRAGQQRSEGSGRVLLVLGEAGSGKTHLMRGFRAVVHEGRAGFVGYMQLSVAAEDYSRFMLIRLIESLEKPYDDPVTPQSGLMCLSDALLHAPASISAESRARLQDSELSDADAATLVCRLADDIVSERRFQNLDLDLIRALLFLQRRSPRVHARVLKFLRCEPLSRSDSEMLGELVSQTDGSSISRMVAQFGLLIAKVDGGALVLLLDQLEDMYNLERPKERFISAMSAVCHVVDHVPNAVVVIAGLRDFYLELKSHLTRSLVDRLERDPEPQLLGVNRTQAEVDALIEQRLKYLYESQGVRHRADQPHFPLDRGFVASLAELSARDVLAQVRDLQIRCIEAGQIIDDAVSTRAMAPPPELPPPPIGLVRAWEDYRASTQSDVPDDDRDLLALLAASLMAVQGELPPSVSLDAKLADEGVIVKVPDRGDGPKKLLIRVTNRSPRGGGLSKQAEGLLRAAVASKSIPVALRCSEFGPCASGALATHFAAIAKRGGYRVVFENTDWRTLLAYRQFHALHKNDPDFAAWKRRERPLLQLESLRNLLALPAASGTADDGFVGAEGKASVPRPSTPKSPSKPPAVSMPPTDERGPVPVVELPKPIARARAENDGYLRLGVTISLRGQTASIPPEQLKRHAAFLGASGSGKTSLALNLIEQLVERGVGVVLLDRKGDLAVYADQERWRGSDPDPERARRKSELKERAHVRLFTPGNPRGRSLRIRAVPEGLDALPPHERGQLARFTAQGLGAMMGYRGRGTEQTCLAILAKSIEVLGQISGRSDLGLKDIVELLAEEDATLVAELGRLEPKHLKRLVDHLETLRLNHGSLLESNDEPLRAEVLLGCDGSVPKGRVPVTIVSTKFLGDPERVDFWVSQLLVELSRWSSRNPAPHLQSVLFLDEADAYMPATTKPATKEPLQDLLKRARSAGLGVMLATQNPGDLDYRGRDTIGTWWIGRVSSTTAIDKMRPLLSECRTDVSGSLATASVGEFFQVYDGQVVRMRTERALMETVQLSEARILELAASKHANARAAERRPASR